MFKGFIKLRAPKNDKFMADLVSFLAQGARRDIVAINMEKGEAGYLDPDTGDVIASLSDTYESEYTWKFAGAEIRLSQHVLIFCNPPYEPLLQSLIHKEVWLAHLGPGALLDEVVWHFPGQAPSVRPYGGRCGYIANPPPVGSAAAIWLDAWRSQSMPPAENMATIIGNAPNAGVQGELAAMSPAAAAYIQHLLNQHVIAGYGRCDVERAALMPRRALPY